MNFVCLKNMQCICSLFVVVVLSHVCSAARGSYRWKNGSSVQLLNICWNTRYNGILVELYRLISLRSIGKVYTFYVIGSFDLLVYTDKDLEVPDSWGESGPQFVADSEEVRLRSFTTTIHKVDTMVAYKKTA